MQIKSHSRVRLKNTHHQSSEAPISLLTLLMLTCFIETRERRSATGIMRRENITRRRGIECAFLDAALKCEKRKRSISKENALAANVFEDFMGDFRIIHIDS